MERSVDLLVGLNESQRRAVTTVDGPVLALAGPGSGKTRVLTHRIAYLIHEKRVHPSAILSVTFTNKAAREMRDRMAKLIGERTAEHVTIGTFHSLAARWLRREARSVDLADSWVIYDDDDQQRLIKRLIKERKLPEKTFTSRGVMSAISSAKSELLDVPTYAQASRSPESRIYAELYGQYQQALHTANALDFDDLLLYGLKLARQERYQQRFAYVLVDEYQDTNKAQYEMVRALSRGSGNIFVVGDDDQSIYGWRGADIRNIRQFEADFPGAQVIVLPENYRSTESILAVAQKLIDAAPKRSHRKILKAQTTGGEPVLWRECSDQNDESQRVCDAIERLVKSGAARYADCAVMYRTNAQSRAFEEALGRRRIPYVLVGGMRFYERREVKDLLAWMRIMANPDDDVSLERALDFPNSGIGQSSLTHLQQWARAHAQSVFGAMVAVATDSQAVPSLKGAARQRVMTFGARLHHLRGRVRTLPLNEAFDAVLSETKFAAALATMYDDSDADARIENVNELRRVSGEYLELPVDEQLLRFLEEVALVADVDALAAGESEAERDNRVVCITMHQAKGLEYDNVFIVGLEDELIPHSRTHLFPEQIDEERRILYVGVTRARKRLMLSRAQRRMLYGRYEPTMTSRFLKDIPRDMLQVTTGLGSVTPTTTTQRAQTLPTTRPEYRGWGDAAKFQTKPAASAPTVDFAVGDRVRHQRFGEGIVMAAKVVDDDVEVVVNFSDKAVGEKRLIASFARLEKIS
ncbi:MAG: ATP-dependent helicase [Roseiflexaceae bacterium]